MRSANLKEKFGKPEVLSLPTIKKLVNEFLKKSEDCKGCENPLTKTIHTRMSSKSSIVDRLMAKGFDKKGLQLNFIFVGFLLVALALTGFVAYFSFNSDQYGSILARIVTVVTVALAGVTGHLLQGPFAHFSVVLFFAVFTFFVNHYKHFTHPKVGDPAAPPAGVVEDMRNSAEILFWCLAFFGFIYLAFVYFPQINALIPTADDAYKMMRRRPAGATQMAPKVAPSATA